MERATFIVPAETLTSRHFRANSSLCRIPVDAAMKNNHFMPPSQLASRSGCCFAAAVVCLIQKFRVA
jgi:hypothetical protein